MKHYIMRLILISFICFIVVPVYAREEDSNRGFDLHQAVSNGDIEQVKSLLSDGVDINSRNRQDWTPLHAAIYQNKKEIIQILLDRNAGVNLITNQGETPMIFAVRARQKETVELLIAKGADVNTVDNQNENALSLSRKDGSREITELLLKHGAQEPGQVANENRRYDRGGGPGRDYTSEDGMGNRLRPEDMQSQRASETDLLADPNEIKARVKTFEGLEKSIDEVSSKSELGMRRWKQTRIDNRATLVNNVQRQIQEEIEFIRKVALEDKATKTVEAADVLLAKKKDRTTKIVREIRAQEKEQRQTRSTSTGRGRGRSTRGSGRTSSQNSSYSERSGRRGTTSRTDASSGDNEDQEQVDPEEQSEIDRWLQADVQDYDSKVTLFTEINEQVLNEFGLIRQVSELEEAKKTTASIDGLLLARKLRYDELNQYIQEEKAKLEQDEQTGRTRGGSDDMGQDNQTGGRRRRR